ncbi:uncharacterized protein LOC110817567 [Carica papaya]|uniref:uncharacterized protein LOC110817567 n=1 Tax=Carica papaya TaxID=3649 RepID=UPI000B8CDD2E|nr:uncharacterized protein LOC110817567 [Carica papaya]
MYIYIYKPLTRSSASSITQHNMVPQWLEILLGQKFFAPCEVHECAKKKKKEKNIFCLDCCISICPHCLPPHASHHHLQIRRYVYHDVVRLGDAQKLIDCSFVQPYTTNNAKVVFLTERSMSRPFRGSGNFCIKCNRSLQHPFLFCSLSCKVQASTNCSTQYENGEMTPNSVLDSPVSRQTQSNSASASSASTTTTTTTISTAVCRFSLSLACTVTTEFIKRKRSVVSLPRGSCRENWSAVADSGGFMRRRKGVPHRSPLN